MVSLSTMTTGDVVKSASVPETMASAVSAELLTVWLLPHCLM